MRSGLYTIYLNILVPKIIPRQKAGPTWGKTEPDTQKKQGFPVSGGHLDLSKYWGVHGKGTDIS